jgi:hypothetical protein
VPPLAVTGVNAVYDVFTVSVVVATACVVVSAELTVRENVCDDVALFASVTRTVYVVAARVAVAVPLISPVVVEKLIPAGSEAAAVLSELRSAKASGEVPPDAVTGVKAVYDVFTVNVFDATACVVDSALFTVRLNVCDDVAPFASVTRTVNVVAACVAVGVPLISPVVVEKLIPAGSVPAALLSAFPRANVYAVVPPLAVTGVNGVYDVLTVSAVVPTA